MAWLGYFEYDGNEILNVTRTESYAKTAGLHWFRPVFKNDALPYMLGDGLTYSTPFMDDAPWADPDFNASFDFYGLYPLDVTGIEDSPRQSNPVESLGEGGVPGRLRHGTKTIVFNCVLLARTEEAAGYGFSWLKRALLGSACGTNPSLGCSGGALCYLSGEPDMYVPDTLSTSAWQDRPEGGVWVDDPEECLTPYLRSLRKVTFNAGPTLTSRRQTSDGASIWTVTFTAVAGNPYEVSAEMPVLRHHLDDSGHFEDQYPLDDDYTHLSAWEKPWAESSLRELQSDSKGYIVTDADCSEPEFTPVYDPEYPAIVPPPKPPNVPLNHYVKPKNWRRRTVRIPKEFVPTWGEVVPKLEVHARNNVDVRNMRVRFYADPFGQGDDSDDNCEYCGEFVVSYVPRHHSLVVDGAEQVVYVEAPGGARQRADSLVFSSDGTPFEWPALTCGFAYVLALDLPQTQQPPSVDLSFYARSV